MRRSNSHWIGRGTLTVALALLAGSSSGCLCTFERDWHAARNRPVPADNLAGLWEGTWLSHYNGHNGKLRAIITPCGNGITPCGNGITPCGNGRYVAQYKGTFAYVVPFAYETTHTARAEPGVTYFSGTDDLGCLAGGVYYMNGRADGATFVAHYRADKDHGVFRMRRVGSCDGCCCVPTSCCDTACGF